MILLGIGEENGGITQQEFFIAIKNTSYYVLGVVPAQVDLFEVNLRQPDVAGLTAREAEVLRLVAQGQSNKEIAAELVLSVRTVERHITNLYGKIDARGKADATAYAFKHGLL